MVEMMMRPEQLPSFNLAVVGLALVLAVTIAALILPAMPPITGTGDDFVRAALPLMFAFISVTNLLVARVLVLPAMFKALREGPTGDVPTVSALSSNANVLALTFSVAPSVYGLILNVMWDKFWIVLPFAVFSSVCLFVNDRYIGSEMVKVRLAERMDGVS
jgi:hypothetical protein